MAPRGEFRVSVTKDYLVFASAHFITFAGHRCEGLHGHNYRASVTIAGALNEQSWFVFDFVELKRIMRRLCDEIDHLVLLPLTSMDEGLEVAKRILHGVRALQLSDEAGHAYGITASLGLSTFRQADRSLRDMLDRADQALYLAKNQGRDQIASLEPLGEQPNRQVAE